MTRRVLLLLLAGCSFFQSGEDTDPAPSDTPVVGDDDTLTDTDDRDNIAPPGRPEVDCLPDASPSPVVEPGACVLTTLACGDVVTGTTVGGSTDFNTEIWEAAFCLDYLLGDPGHLDAAERVFELDVAPDTFAVVQLDSPCARMDMRAVRTTRSCNTEAGNCTTASGNFAFSEVSLAGTETGSRWEIIVDGYDGDEGNFRLTVDCGG